MNHIWRPLKRWAINTHSRGESVFYGVKHEGPTYLHAFEDGNILTRLLNVEDSNCCLDGYSGLDMMFELQNLEMRTFSYPHYGWNFGRGNVVPPSECGASRVMFRTDASSDKPAWCSLFGPDCVVICGHAIL